MVIDAADGQVLAEAAESIGVATNNVAEYRGLIAGLRAVLELAGDGAEVDVRMDSKLVVEQMSGRWKIKHADLRPLAPEAGGSPAAAGDRVDWIPRERNKHADRLANEAMDAAAKGLTWKAGGSATPRETITDASPAQGAGGPATSDAAARRAASDSGAQRTGGSVARGAASLAEQTDLLDAGDIPELSAPTASVAAAQQRTRGTGWSPPTHVATSLLLLRHGETPLSVERRFSGPRRPRPHPQRPGPGRGGRREAVA